MKISDIIDKNGKPIGTFKIINTVTKIGIVFLMFYYYSNGRNILGTICAVIVFIDLYNYYNTPVQTNIQKDIDKIKSKMKKA